jgi:hypothetical protein
LKRLIKWRLWGVIWTISLLLAIQAQATGVWGNRFGVVEGMWFPDLTCDLGVGWERLIFDWSQHQPEKPDDWYTLSVDDRWLKAADGCNREVVALVKNTPIWATDGIGGAGVPKNLDLPIDDPDNYWANFIRKTVDYYASRGVFHYIIWNEPDISADTYGHEFSGELEDYYQLLKVAYLVAKDTNPAVVIHLAGTTYWHDVNEGRTPYYERLIQRIQQDPQAQQHDYYFDVLSLHIYFRTETVYEIVNIMQAMLEKYGLDKRIWINEMNAAPTDDPQWQVVRPQFPLDLSQQASFIVQATALALVNDVERIAVYKLYDQQLPVGGESFGILNPSDASPRPAFFAWRMITRYFSDTVSAQLAQSDTVDVVRVYHTNDQQSIIAWAKTATPTGIEITATGEKAYLIDQVGNLSIVMPQNGVYKLTLRGARCNPNDGCFIGGEPVILVQLNGETTVYELNAEAQRVLIFIEEL